MKVFPDYRETGEVPAFVSFGREQNGLIDFLVGRHFSQHGTVGEELSQLTAKHTPYSVLINPSCVALACCLQRPIIGKTKIHFIPRAERIEKPKLTFRQVN